jgi:RecA/RadA recombinase
LPKRRRKALAAFIDAEHAFDNLTPKNSASTPINLLIAQPGQREQA